MAPSDDLGGFDEATDDLVIADPPARRASHLWIPLALGAVVILVVGILIGMAIERNEDPDSIVATATTVSTPTTAPFFDPTTTLAPAPTTIARSASPTTRRAPASTAPRAATATTRRPAAAPATSTTRPPAERIVGRTSGGGSGTGSSSVSFSVTGAWRIDHSVRGAEANVTVVDQAGGYSFGYTAAVGNGSRTFNRTCTCRIVVSSPDGTYTVTVVDVDG